jgi:hypothetical protein
VTFWFVFNKKILALFAGKLSRAGLFGVEMVKTRFARKNLAIFGKFQSLAI